jgi:transcriptional regulator with XRE-family HTH domain
MDLGKSLRIALVHSGKTQMKLADDFNISRQTVSRWANTGNMTQETIKELSSYFDMRPSEFVALGE